MDDGGQVVRHGEIPVSDGSLTGTRRRKSGWWGAKRATRLVPSRTLTLSRHLTGIIHRNPHFFVRLGFTVASRNTYLMVELKP
jgi:hypothetical protein